MFLAKVQGLEEGVAETLVLVKSLQSRDEQQQLDFRREFEMFGKLNHANVVRLLGLCREAEPHYMVLEYVELVCCWQGSGGLGQRSALGGWRGHRGNLVLWAPLSPWPACCCHLEMLSLLPTPAPQLSHTCLSSMAPRLCCLPVLCLGVGSEFFPALLYTRHGRFLGLLP